MTAPLLHHHLEHVAVADLAGGVLDSHFPQEREEPEIAHHGGDDQVVASASPRSLYSLRRSPGRDPP